MDTSGGSPGHVHQSPGFTSCLCSGLGHKSKFGLDQKKNIFYL